MSTPQVTFSVRDDRGRRSGFERRQFSYVEHIPDRREGAERRSGLDRRGNEEQGNHFGQQEGI